MSGGTLTGLTNGGLTHGGGALDVGRERRYGIFNFRVEPFGCNKSLPAAAHRHLQFRRRRSEGRTGQQHLHDGTESSFNISQATAHPATIDDNGVIVTIANNSLHGAFAATDAGIIEAG